MNWALLYKTCGFVLSILCANLVFAQKATLKGVVKSGGEILQSASVTIADQFALTDGQGKFSITINPGEYIVVVTHAGYKLFETRIVIVAGKEISLEVNLTRNDELDEATIMGSRSGTVQSNLETTVPIDVISSEKLMQTNQPSLIQMLFYALPSLNTDRQKVYEPVTYRGMDPHHLLILLNNNRYHNSAWLNNGVPKSDLGRGSSSNDVSTIPFIAIDKVEILRDGASAQYGSDAIAAVLNFRLRESTGRTLINVNTGQYYKGDGFKSWIGLYKGFLLKNPKLLAERQGFISFSSEVRIQDPTTRSGIYDSLVYEVYRHGMTDAERDRVKVKDDSTLAANGIDRRTFSKNSGTAKVRSFGVLVNGAYPINDRLRTVWTASLNYKKNYFWGNYRYPNAPARVNIILYPHGFKPIPTSANWDATVIAGIKGNLRHRWQWEFSSSLGNNTNRNEVENSNNASQQHTLGAAAPTSFYLGTLVYNLFTNNIIFTKDLAKKYHKGRSNKLLFGIEWRVENYRLRAGDEAGYTDYDGAGPKQGGAQPSIGSISSADAVNKSRWASSAYINWEIEPNDRWLIDAASRFEYFEDFGSNIAGKFAVRYIVSPKLNIRSSISNGYRAPGLQQRYWSGLQSFRGSTEIVRVFNNESPVTRAFHIPSLTAERATNASLGFTSKLSSFLSFTLDGYFIQVENRIVLSGIFRRTDPQVDSILRPYPGIDLVQFYTNAINTRTYGIDAVINGNWRIKRTSISLTLAANINRHSIYGTIKSPDVVTNISNYTNTLFGLEERMTLKRDQPREKIILSAHIKKGKYSFSVRNTYFGSTAVATISGNGADTSYQTFSPRVLTDCSISFKPKSWVTITLGINNILNIYPERLKPLDPVNLYSNAATPYGTNGGYYFLNMNFDFN